jgi:hypothetical protein
MAKLVALFLVGLSSAPFTALADEAPTPRTALEQRLAHLNTEQVASGKLSPVRREELYKERRTVQNLIKRLEAGEKVDPKEIDQVLGVREPAYFEKRP